MKHIYGAGGVRGTRWNMFSELWKCCFVHSKSFLITDKSIKNEFMKLIHCHIHEKRKKIKFPLKLYVENQLRVLPDENTLKSKTKNSHCRVALAPGILISTLSGECPGTWVFTKHQVTPCAFLVSNHWATVSLNVLLGGQSMTSEMLDAAGRRLYPAVDWKD